MAIFILLILPETTDSIEKPEDPREESHWTADADIANIKELTLQILRGDQEGIELVACEEYVKSARLQLETALIMGREGSEEDLKRSLNAYAFLLAAEEILTRDEALFLDSPSTVANRIMRAGRKTLRDVFQGEKPSKKKVP